MNAIEIKDLTKTFGKICALDHLSLNIEKGKISGLIGADGAGKTTLIRLIVGLLSPDSGSISVLGLDPLTQKEELTAKIGYMPQKFGLYEDLSVIENLKLYADLKNQPHHFDKMLEFTSLTPFQDRLAGALSGGMKQKLGLACALLGTPDLLLLDEPSVGVDPISRRDLMKMVREMINPQTTVLWLTAYLDEAHSFDTAIVLDKGRCIFNGKPHDLAQTSQAFEDKVIELMGGYKKETSKIAQNYKSLSDFEGYAVEAHHLEKKYGNFYAVKNNSFQIQKGEIFGLLGPNGAGKSTSFKMMCGLAKPTSGTAKIMGIDIAKNPTKARSNLGYMAQKFSLYGSLSLRENLEFFASVYGVESKNHKQRINEIIEIFDFWEIEHIKSEDLPLGFKQRLSMACALIHNPLVLFLDEPTSGVDVLARKEFWNHITSLSKKGVTILITTHFMDEAEYCDRISLFYKGEAIAIGTPDELKQKAGAANMEDAFITLIKESGQ
ncbi:ABC transporter ATP-binding protein [Helicobacter sp. MIT 05-5293]|uniref:ATP-binding cassette domain-containing protein n=1 Tax=Helicobacter sp. MIT 05-5293 TaxID=1548149 RepID=UPI0010FD0B35|nr:ATP-binding cassette domain-containing protein [Helicobacter sp. MIT 05-5293]TLD80109.1 ABC transporter ATP-binding protein [Helicobacter sp. MIT 05-5293]